MEQFNKIISFVLGLAVVIIFLLVATGKINLKGKLPIFSSGSSSSKAVTPTPASKTTALNPTNSTMGGIQTKGGLYLSPTPSAAYHSYSSPGAVSTIPSTGPELLLPMAFAAFAGGSFLRRTGKKQ